jgi:threonine synthase
MIQIMNDVAWQIHEAYPDVEIKEVQLRDGVKSTKTWLRNSLFRLTADIRLKAEEHNIVCE